MAVAALAPLVIQKGVQARQDAAQAIKNDIVVIRTTRTSGKGKKKHTTDYEIHVNPTSIATGVAVVGGAAVAGTVALYVAGFDVKRNAGQAKTVTIRRTGDPPVWRVYSAKGIPYKTLGAEFDPSRPNVLLMDGQEGRNWVVKDVKKNRDDMYTAVLYNDSKNHFVLAPRERNPWFSLFTGDGISIPSIPKYDELPWWMKWPYLPV
jgi:hypothetical protein